MGENLQHHAAGRWKPTKVLWVALPVLVVMACGGKSGSSGQSTTIANPSSKPTTADVTSSTTAQPTTTTISPAQQAFDYFDQFAENTGLGYKRMKDLANFNSPAYRYAEHQERFFIARTTAGFTVDPSTIQVEGDELVTCADERCAEDTRYSDFLIEADRLTSFSVEGRPLSKTLPYRPPATTQCYVIGNGACDSAQSVDIKVMTVYRTGADEVVVTFDWRRGRKATGSLNAPSRTVNGQLRFSSYANVGGTRIAASGGVMEPPGLDQTKIGALIFANVPEDSPVTLVVKIRWDGETLDYEFKFDSW